MARAAHLFELARLLLGLCVADVQLRRRDLQSDRAVSMRLGVFAGWYEKVRMRFGVCGVGVEKVRMRRGFLRVEKARPCP